MFVSAVLLLTHVAPASSLMQTRAAGNLDVAPVSVRIYMEPGCEHCRAYMIGPLKAAMSDDSIASMMDLDVSPFGNAFYAIPECEESVAAGAVIGCGGAGGYDAGKRACFNQRCGLGVLAADRAADCFTAPLVPQFGFLQLYASRYLLCAKRESKNASSPWRKYAPFFICMEEHFDEIHDGVSTSAVAKTCAESTGFDYDKLVSCYERGDAELAFKDEAAATPDHPGVPYIIVNGKAVDESYDANALVEAVRSAAGLAAKPSKSTSLLATQRERTIFFTGVQHKPRREITC